MAGMTRLELAASALTGQRSNQLSYTPTLELHGSPSAFRADERDTIYLYKPFRVKRLAPLFFTTSLYAQSTRRQPPPHRP